MKLTFVTVLLVLFSIATSVAAEATPEVTTAILPLPAKMRDGAAVVRLNPAGFPESLKEGTNHMVCIADRPGNDTFDVRCYHQDFIAVVYRGFQLSADGVRGAELTSRIEAEIKSGKLKIPSQPTAGYRCLGPISGLNATTNSLSGEIRCWQSIHFPFRTSHEMGLTDESEISNDMRVKMPYVMASGTYWAHVMIEHPLNEKATDHSH